MRKLSVLFNVLIVVLLFSQTSFAATLHVPDDYPTIQAAVDAAQDSDTILLSIGMYSGPGNRDVVITGKSLTIEGQYGPANTHIDVGGSEGDFHRAFEIKQASGKIITIKGLCIFGGYHSQGGAIYSDNGILNVNNCKFEANSALVSGGKGGAIYIDDGDVNVSDSVFLYNNADGHGGAICSEFGDVIVSDCLLENNSGSGIIYSRFLLKVNDTIMNDNAGEAVSCDGELIVENCELTNNFSGVSCHGDATVKDSIITGSKGEGIRVVWGSLLVENSIISFNNKGGIYSLENTKIYNSVIAGNYGMSGGGIYCGGGDNCIVNCVIADNLANEGSAISTSLSGELRLVNSIVWNNISGDGKQLDLGSSYDSTYGKFIVHNCDIQNGMGTLKADPAVTIDWHDSNINADPCFASKNDYRLTTQSPCIDAGAIQETEFTYPQTDIRGYSRILDSNSDGTAVADMGAFEYDPDVPELVCESHTIDLFVNVDSAQPFSRKLMVKDISLPANVHVFEDADWLEVEPSIFFADEQIELTLNISPQNLPHAKYETDIRLVPEGFPEREANVKVNLHINVTRKVPQEYQTIQSALDAALVDGDEVLIDDGVYIGPENRNLRFNNANVKVKSLNGPDNCIIDCQQQGTGFLLVDGCDSPALIQGLTIKNGSYDPAGSGILCFGKIEVSDCVIKNCVSNLRSYGFGIYAHWGSTIKNSIIESNTGGITGYGIAVQDCIIRKNYNQPGLLLFKGMSSVANSEFYENTSGAVAVSGAYAKIENCKITNNEDFTSHPAVGAGIQLYGKSYSDISNCLIAGNQAYDGGCGIYCSYSSVLIKNCTVVGNKCYNYYGGGLYASNSDNVEIHNSIFWDNDANDFGDQIAVGYDERDETRMHVEFCDIQGGQAGVFAGTAQNLDWGFGNIDLEPSFAQNGYWNENSPQDPMDDVWNCGDYHLKSQQGRYNPAVGTWTYDNVTSPCIDAGNPSFGLGQEFSAESNVRINMGAYGGTDQASRTPAGFAILCDITNDCLVNSEDLFGLAQYWLDDSKYAPTDFDRNGKVDLADFAVLADSWLF